MKTETLWKVFEMLVLFEGIAIVMWLTYTGRMLLL